MRHERDVIDVVCHEAAVTHGEDPTFWCSDGIEVSLVEWNDKSGRNNFDVELVIAEISFQSLSIAVDLLRQLLEVHLLCCGIYRWRLYMLGFKEVGYESDDLRAEDYFHWSQTKGEFKICFINLFFRQVAFNMVHVTLTHAEY